MAFRYLLVLVGLLGILRPCMGDSKRLFGDVRDLSSQYASQRTVEFESCSDPTHCKTGCQCVNRTCVNLEHFSAAVDTCHRCASNITEQCNSNGDKCYSGIGYCSKCSDRAVSIGLGSCMTGNNENEEEKTGHIDLVFPHEIPSEVTIEPTPVVTPEIPVAVPPGASAKPTVTPTPNSNPSEASTSTPYETPEMDSTNATTGIDTTKDLDKADCVDYSWLQSNGHTAGVLKVSGLARVVCLKDKNLPCGTPGHLLRSCIDGYCTLVSYSELCARLNGCTEKTVTVARLRAAYNWETVSDGMISLTSLSEGKSIETQIIAIIGYIFTRLRLGKVVDLVSTTVIGMRAKQRDFLATGSFIQMCSMLEKPWSATGLNLYQLKVFL